MRAIGFAVVALLLGAAWAALNQALVATGILSGDAMSRDAGIVTMMIFLSMACWFREK